jgi:hypothetical protein
MVTELPDVAISLAPMRSKRDKILDIPWFYQVGDGENDAEDGTEAPDNNVSNSKEGVFAAHGSASRNENRFRSAIFTNREVYIEE